MTDDSHVPDNEPDRKRRRVEDVKAQIAGCDRELDSLAAERIEGQHGESFTAEGADEIAKELEQRIRSDKNAGVLIHTPATKGQRRLARGVPYTDYLVFLYFLAVVFNVDWTDPRRTPVPAVLALVLAIIATAGVAWTLRSIAAQERQIKPDDNRFPWRQHTRQGGVQMNKVLLVLILLAVGAMMFYRIYSDARASGLPVAPSLLIAAFFALVTSSLNYVIFLIEYIDGSIVTDELRQLRARLEPIHNRIAATQRRRRELQQRLDTLREAPEASTPAVPASPTSPPSVDADRDHQATGPRTAESPEPSVNGNRDHEGTGSEQETPPRHNGASRVAPIDFRPTGPARPTPGPIPDGGNDAATRTS